MEETISRGVCEIEHSGKSDEEFKKCSEQCVWRCNEISYVPMTYVSAWPTEQSIRDFVEKYIVPLDEEHPIRKYYNSIQNHYSHNPKVRIWPTLPEFIHLIQTTAAENKFNENFINQVVAKLSLSADIDTKLQNFTTFFEAEEHWVKTTFYRFKFFFYYLL